MKLQLPEIVSVGIYNAQIANKRKTITENRKTTMFEIELPIENGGQSYIDKETQKITPNLLICAKPGQVRHTKLPFKCYYIHMIVTKGPLYDTLMSIPNYMILQDPSEFARLFEQLYESHHSGIPENELLTHSLVLSLAYKLKQCTPLPVSDYPTKHNHHIVIEQAIRYIRENLSSELSLALLAERANFSPIYFHNLFKTSTGQTTHEYIQQQRIKKAMHLLVTTSMTLAQICYECGFSSQSYFNFVFKRNTGCTPRAYAKQVAESYHND